MYNHHVGISGGDSAGLYLVGAPASPIQEAHMKTRMDVVWATRRERYGPSGTTLPTPAQDAERFWSKVRMGPGCWEWASGKNPFGYGMFAVTRDRQRKWHMAHRYAWCLTFGEESDRLVLHRCDNPSCVNPSHLFAGTQSDNVQDMIAKGRHGNIRKTHCPRGHLLTMTSRGYRACRPCRAVQSAEYRRRKSEDRRIAHVV